MAVTGITTKRYGLFGNATANKLYNLDTLAQITNGVGGSMSGNLFKLTPTFNNVYLFIQGETKSYYMDAATETVTQVASAGYPANHLVPGVVSIDGYILVMDQVGNIVHSAVADPTTWDALNTVQANSEPDAAVTIAKHLNMAVAFKEFTTEWFYDAANPTGSAFSNQPNYKLDIGCAAAYSVADIDGNLFWVGQSRKGGRAVYLLPDGGLTPVRISTEREDNIIAQFASNTAIAMSMKAWCFKTRGHMCYALTDASQNLTMVFDMTSREWTYMTSVVSGTERYVRFYGALPSTSLAVTGSPIVTVDEATGSVYLMAPQYFQDNGGDIRVQSQTVNADGGTMKRKFFPAAELVGDTVTTTVQVSWSDDDYQTFSAPRTIDMSAQRKIIRNLGSANRRAFNLLHVDNTPLRLQAIELPDVKVGGA